MPERSTVVVVTWRGRDHIATCLDALAGQTRPHQLLVIDNGSHDGTDEVLRKHPARAEVLRLPENMGYAGAISVALRHVRTPFLAWLNDDAAPAPEWLAALENALDEGAAAASSVLSYPDGTVQSVGVRLTADGHGADALNPENRAVFGFCGGAALVRMDALQDVGGVPAEFFCYYEDTDTSWRLRLAGHRIVTAPDASAVHLHGASSEPGSRQFHHWNERNRLLTLLRCAPRRIAAREIVRFTGITCLLPLRRALGRSRTTAANFHVSLRIRVLLEVVTRLPSTLRARRAIGRRSTVSRRLVWTRWAGSPRSQRRLGD